MTIKTIVNEARRGCGFRKPGGTYLVSDGPGLNCNRLPFPLTVCPCCSAGIKPSRGWTWVNGKVMLATNKEWMRSDGCKCNRHPMYAGCILLSPSDKVGLLWIGESFYKTPEAFSKEAAEQGISRRIHCIPREFKVGETQVWLAHRKAFKAPCPDCSHLDKNLTRTELFCPTCHGIGTIQTPGVFSAFIPQRIEYIITGEETQEELDRKEKAGITLIKLERR